jgi:hypothetical protein
MEAASSPLAKYSTAAEEILVIENKMFRAALQPKHTLRTAGPQ